MNLLAAPVRLVKKNPLDNSHVSAFPTLYPPDISADPSGIDYNTEYGSAIGCNWRQIDIMSMKHPTDAVTGIPDPFNILMWSCCDGRFFELGMADTYAQLYRYSAIPL